MVILDEDVRGYKRRKVAGSLGLRRQAQPNVTSARKPRTRIFEQKTDRSVDISRFEREQAPNHADTSYQEWPLPDAVLQRILVNGRAILQLQFTWAASCASHITPEVGSMLQPLAEPRMHRNRQHRHTRTRVSETDSMNDKTERLGHGHADD